jgi:RNA polymerase sigma factor FliA
VVEESSDAGRMPEEEAALWARYLDARDNEARQQLIERHLPIAQTVAATLYASRVDNTVDFGDYLQYARMGLLEAMERYDPARGASFATFASYRIRGAVLNGLEKSTELMTQRAQRRRLRRERLKSIQEQPADAEQTDAFAQVVDLTLSLAIGYLLEESGIWKGAEADRASDPYQTFELKRLRERMTMLLQALPDREREIVRHHYFEHKDFIEISEALGLSKGRVSQLHSRALRLLREGYQALEQFDKRV